MQRKSWPGSIHLVFERISHAHVARRGRGTSGCRSLFPPRSLVADVARRLTTVRFIKSGLSKPITLSRRELDTKPHL